MSFSSVPSLCSMAKMVLFFQVPLDKWSDHVKPLNLVDSLHDAICFYSGTGVLPDMLQDAGEIGLKIIKDHSEMLRSVIKKQDTQIYGLLGSFIPLILTCLSDNGFNLYGHQDSLGRIELANLSITGKCSGRHPAYLKFRYADEGALEILYQMTFYRHSVIKQCIKRRMYNFLSRLDAKVYAELLKTPRTADYEQFVYYDLQKACSKLPFTAKNDLYCFKYGDRVAVKVPEAAIPPIVNVMESHLKAPLKVSNILKDLLSEIEEDNLFIGILHGSKLTIAMSPEFQAFIVPFGSKVVKLDAERRRFTTAVFPGTLIVVNGKNQIDAKDLQFLSALVSTDELAEMARLLVEEKEANIVLLEEIRTLY
jgi:hypothetical protein